MKCCTRRVRISDAILGMSEQLAATLPDGAAREQSGTIQRAGRSMLQLVNDLLELSRMEAGRLELRPLDVSVASVITWLEAMMQPASAGKGVAFQVVAAPVVPSTLWLDEERFRQILLNLASNAMKFTPPGGQVLVRLERDPPGPARPPRFMHCSMKSASGIKPSSPWKTPWNMPWMESRRSGFTSPRGLILPSASNPSSAWIPTSSLWVR